MHTRIAELDGDSRIIPMQPRRHNRHISDLIDPQSLPETHVRLPDGTIMTKEEWAINPNRPLSLRERREKIQRKTQERLASRAEGTGSSGLRNAVEMEEEGTKGKRTWREKLSCFK